MSLQRKHVEEEEHESQERWLISYADFITLLFALFVVLYATSSQNIEKEKKFEQSIRSEFKYAAVPVGNSAVSNDMGARQVIEPIEVFQKRNSGSPELAESVERLIARTMTPEERKLAIASIRYDSMGVRISLAAGAFFPSGQSDLKSEALKPLDKIAKILKMTDRRIIVEGHTDNQPLVSDKIASNWELASLRATSVVRYLIQSHQIDPSRLGAASYADQKPVAPNDTDAHRAQNRRIELLIVNSDEE